MKADLHPALNSVAFVDVSTGHKFLTQSTMRGSKTETIDGNEYQVVICDITSDSHPAFTGEKTPSRKSGVFCLRPLSLQHSDFCQTHQQSRYDY